MFLPSQLVVCTLQVSTLTLVLLLYCTFVHPRVFDGVSVAHLFSFLCFVLCLVYLRPVSTVPDVASFSGLSILVSDVL